VLRYSPPPARYAHVRQVFTACSLVVFGMSVWPSAPVAETTAFETCDVATEGSPSALEQELLERDAMLEAIAAPLIGSGGEDRSVAAPREASGAGRKDYVGARGPGARGAKVPTAVQGDDGGAAPVPGDSGGVPVLEDFLVDDSCGLAELMECMRSSGGGGELSSAGCESCLANATARLRRGPPHHHREGEGGGRCERAYAALGNETVAEGICGFTIGALSRAAGRSWMDLLSRAVWGHLVFAGLLAMDFVLAGACYDVAFRVLPPTRLVAMGVMLACGSKTVALSVLLPPRWLPFTVVIAEHGVCAVAVISTGFRAEVLRRRRLQRSIWKSRRVRIDDIFDPPPSGC
jgi:hypothetical protein